MKRPSLIGIAAVLVMAVALAACSSKPRARYHSRADRMKFIREHGLEKLPPTDVPIEINERVVAWMDYFSGSGSRHFERYLMRSGRYIDMMQKILKKYGLPKDLIYVALIESGFNTQARSHAAAVGPWQFIQGTGKRYGLRIDAWVDERCDPEKSTHAAARYLRDLYREFGHWYLAMAGYNAGEGRVRRAIADSGSKNFWVHADPDRNHLRAETRDYVPKFIAATVMAKKPEEFGFGSVKYWEPMPYEEVTIPSQTDLQVVAECAGVKRYDIEELNPELRLSATPPGVSNYTLRLPKGTKDRFVVAYAKVPADDRIKLVMHRVQRREKLAWIARRYGVSIRSLARANGISQRARLSTGQQLVIPIGAAYKTRIAKAGDDDGGGRARRKLVHKVRHGETLGKIARKYGVTTAQLKMWNSLNSKGTIRAGQRLKIYKSGGAKVASSGRADTGSGSTAVSHRVRAGETLSTISRKYGVSVAELKRINGISGSTIRAGQTITIRKKAAARVDVAAASDDDGGSPEPAVAKSSSSSTTHTIASGETLGHVAEKYGVSTKDLMRWNKISDPRRVRSGSKLVIKGASSAPAEPKVAAARDEEETAPAAGHTAVAVGDLAETKPLRAASSSTVVTTSSTTHALAAGETLGHVAEKYGVSTKDLMRWNKISDPRRVRVGTKLKIKGATSAPATAKKAAATKQVGPVPVKDLALAPVETGESEPAISMAASEAPFEAPPGASASLPPASRASTTYKIKSGDSLWSIARKHGVSVSEIRTWNDMGSSDTIKPGQKIIIKK